MTTQTTTSAAETRLFTVIEPADRGPRPTRPLGADTMTSQPGLFTVTEAADRSPKPPRESTLPPELGLVGIPGLFQIIEQRTATQDAESGSPADQVSDGPADQVSDAPTSTPSDQPRRRR